MPVHVKKTRQSRIVAFSSEVGAGSREENASSFCSVKKQDPEGPVFTFNAANAISVMVMMVMMMVVMATRAHNDHWPVSAPGMMMVVMMVMVLRKLNIFTRRGNWS
jgi:hypothetical protein